MAFPCDEAAAYVAFRTDASSDRWDKGMRQFIDGYPGQKIETLLANTAKPVRQARRKTNRTEYRVRDTVRTARGEGVIKFVFQCGPNGKTTYSVGFANKRLGIIFHENELAPGSARAPAHLA